MEGELPEAPGPAALAVSVITEGVTNAVRHGYASRIDASCLGSGGVYSVEIRNSGRVPGSAVCEGGGLGGLRKKIEAAGGSLFVSAAPVFTVRAEIPAGINGEDSGEGMEI
jgi:signal transduction histidine kinase